MYLKLIKINFIIFMNISFNLIDYQASDSVWILIRFELVQKTYFFKNKYFNV